jgi:hypothetical protein
MVDPIRLGQLSRVATLRRDRSEIALAEASTVRTAREQALVAAEAAAKQAAAQARKADRMFAAEPASDQAMIWRRVQTDRAAQARAVVSTSTSARDAAIEAQDAARTGLMRAGARLDRTSDLHAKALVAYGRLREDREAEDRPASTRGVA